MASTLSHLRTLPKLTSLRRLTTTSAATPSPSPTISLPTLQPSPTADQISQLLIQHHNPFQPTESSLQLNGISLSSNLLHQVLLRLKHASKAAVSFFAYAKSSCPNLAIDTAAYNIVVDILGKVRQFDAAWQLIVEMDQSEAASPNSTTFGVLIRRLIAAGLTRQAIRTFDDMECFVKEDVTKDDFCYLVDTLCKYGYVKVATEIFNKRKDRFGPDAKIYTVLIYGWCKINRVNMGERFLKDMVECGIEPNVVTYNVLLNGICRNASLHPDDRFESIVKVSENLFKEMRGRGIEPDVTSYSIVLHLYSRAHKPELSLDKLRVMKEKGISPTTATYNSVVKCLCSCGRLEDAEKLVSEMEESGVSPSACTYNSFFKEYRGRNDAKSALALYRRMKVGSSSCVPDIRTYNILLVMFAVLDKADTVQEIWDDMKVSGVGPDLDTYTLLVHELCGKQKWEEACKFFVEMIEKGLLPQKVTFETLYRGLIQSDKLRSWRRLKKKLDEESITFCSEFEKYHLKPYQR